MGRRGKYGGVCFKRGLLDIMGATRTDILVKTPRKGGGGRGKAGQEQEMSHNRIHENLSNDRLSDSIRLKTLAAAAGRGGGGTGTAGPPTNPKTNKKNKKKKP